MRSCDSIPDTRAWTRRNVCSGSIPIQTKLQIPIEPFSKTLEIFLGFLSSHPAARETKRRERRIPLQFLASFYRRLPPFFLIANGSPQAIPQKGKGLFLVGEREREREGGMDAMWLSEVLMSFNRGSVINAI